MATVLEDEEGTKLHVEVCLVGIKQAEQLPGQIGWAIRAPNKKLKQIINGPIPPPMWGPDPTPPHFNNITETPRKNLLPWSSGHSELEFGHYLKPHPQLENLSSARKP